jgi:hypothetical protein
VSEQEYRYVWIDSDDDYDADGDDVPIRGSVLQIFLGANFEDVHLPKMKEIHDRYGINVWRVTYLTGPKNVLPVFVRSSA